MATQALRVLLHSVHHLPDQMPSLLLYSAYSHPPFRSIHLGGRRNNCSCCSDRATTTQKSALNSSADYAAFCGERKPTSVLAASERLAPLDYHSLRDLSGGSTALVDVREKQEYDIAHLKGSINVPYGDITRDPDASFRLLESGLRDGSPSPCRRVVFVCRHGNDSQVAARLYQDSINKTSEAQDGLQIRDIRGGLWAWRQLVDPSFPEY